MTPKAAADPRPSAANERESSEPVSDSLAIQLPLDVRSVALTILAVLASVFFLHQAEALIIPFVLGVLISYALDPIVTRMVNFKVPRALAAALVTLTLVGVCGTLLYQLRFQA